MQTHKFKTNINCSGCLKSVTPALNSLPNAEWQVDLNDPDRTLTVTCELPPEQVQAVVEKAGFKATEK